jgi:succinoglycan biosynthesis transport protein ExoP
MVGQQGSERAKTDGALDFDMRQLPSLLWRYKWSIAGIFTAFVAVAMVVTLSMTKVYEAEVTIEFDPNPPRPLGEQVEDLSRAGNVNMLEWIQTQNHIISSRTVALRVVERLALHRDPSFMGVKPEERANWKGVDKEVAAKQLLSRLNVRQEKITRISRIIVDDHDPQRAAVLANAVADAYLTWVMEERLSSTVHAVEWLSGQLDDASKKLHGSEHALYDFRREKNVLSLSLEDQHKMLAETISRFTGEINEITKRRLEREAELRQLEDAARDPSPARIALLSMNETLFDLRKKYLELQEEVQSQSALYGPKHPVMLQLRPHLESTSAAMREEVQSMVAAKQSEVRKIKDIEAGLRQALAGAQKAGLEVSLSEIDYARLERERANNERLHGVLLQRTTETGLTRLLRVSPVRLVDRAVVPTVPFRPKPVLTVAIGALVGLLAGLGWVFLRVRMDRSVTSPEEIEVLGTTVLGVVPSIFNDAGSPYGSAYYGRGSKKRRQKEVPTDTAAKDLVVHTHPHSAVAECCRTIRTNLAFMSTDTPLKSLVVTSPGPTEGKSTLAISLAVTMANSGRRVVLVDTDLRRPRLHRAFGTRGQVGVTTWLAGEASLAECLQQTDVSGLALMPSGVIPPNPSELLHTARFERLIAELHEEFDFAILDSPPVGVVIDSAIIGPRVGGAILVAKAGRTTRDALIHALRQMGDVGTNVLGAVLNEVDLSKQGAYGYYYTGGYYASEDEGGRGGGDAPTAAPPVAPTAR